jgi:hypothetical protein
VETFENELVQKGKEEVEAKSRKENKKGISSKMEKRSISKDKKGKEAKKLEEQSNKKERK